MPSYPTNRLPNVPFFEHPLFERYLPEIGWGPDFIAVARGLRENGFAVVNFPEAGFDPLADRIIQRYNKGSAGAEQEVCSIEQAWSEDEDVRGLACNASILNLLRVVYARKPFPFYTCTANGGGEAIKSDVLTYSSRPERFICGVWLALEDVGEGSSAFHVYPGSHSWPIYSNDQLGLDFSKFDVEPTVANRADLMSELVDISGVSPQPLPLKKGQCVIYAGSLVYQFTAPSSDKAKPSWAQQTRYYFDDCVYWDLAASDTGMGEQVYRRPVNILTGEIVNSSYLSKQVVE